MIDPDTAFWHSLSRRIADRQIHNQQTAAMPLSRLYTVGDHDLLLCDDHAHERGLTLRTSGIQATVCADCEEGAS